MSNTRYIKGVDVSSTDVEDEVLILLSSLGGATPRNQLLNSNFDIWQRGASRIYITSRSRTDDVATVVTELEHGYVTGDRVQVSHMSNTEYNQADVLVTIVDETTFTYENAGVDEATTAESSGHTTLLTRNSLTVEDQEYIADRWVGLISTGQLIVSDDDGINIEQTDTAYSGLIQVIPSRYRTGSTFSISLKAKASTGTPKVRIALLEWAGTIDDVDFNVVDTWSGDPTLETDWSYAGKSDQVTMTTSYQTISKENITAGGNNIAFVIFTESIGATGELQIKECQLIESETIADYEAPIFEYEINECRKFYQKSYVYSTPAGVISEKGKVELATSFGVSNGNIVGTVLIDRMYKQHSVTFYGSQEPPEENHWVVSTGVNVDIIASNEGESSFAIVNDSGFSISTSSLGGHFVCKIDSI